MIIEKYIHKFEEIYRRLRNGKQIYYKDFHDLAKLSWITTQKLIDELTDYGAIKKCSNSKYVLNPKACFFAGIYISKYNIELSIIDLDGEEIIYKCDKYIDLSTLINSLQEMIKEAGLIKCKAISICSDNYMIIKEGIYRMTDYITLIDSAIEYKIPKELVYYLENSCVTNSWKWYADNDIKKSDLNVIVSFLEDRYFYTVMKNGMLIQKVVSANVQKDLENFYEDLIMPIVKSINPDNFIFLAPSDDMYNLIQNKIEDSWIDKTFCNKADIFKFDNWEYIYPTNMITKICSRVSHGAAMHALYKYFGWIK